MKADIENQYRQAVEYLYNVPKFTTKSTPKMTRAFYEYLGAPGEEKCIIHVAGTNGKGSVCCYLNGILTEHNRKTGLFTSPHLVSMCERFRIGGEQMEEAVFVKYFLLVREKLAALKEQKSTVKELPNDYHPSFFEYLFFMAMLWFEDENAEYIILETGLGGRLDATNVIKKPKLCVITKIGMDHTMYLGDTIEQIAQEKAGIIKENTALLFYDFDKKVTEIMEKNASLCHSVTYPVKKEDITNVKIHEKYIDFCMRYEYDNCVCPLKEEFMIPTVATYQTVNATMAVKASGYLLGEKWELPLVKKALAKTFWEGRMEEVKPDFYVDGAHNEDGIEAFLEGLKAVGEQNAVLLFGVNGDKDYEPMIKRIAQSGYFCRIVVTKLSGERSANPKDIAAVFKRYTDIEPVITMSVKEAEKACRKVGGGSRIYAVGSLYLVGEIKELLREELL